MKKIFSLLLGFLLISCTYQSSSMLISNNVSSIFSSNMTTSTSNAVSSSTLESSSSFDSSINSSTNLNQELKIIALEMKGTYGDSFIVKFGDFEMLVDAGTNYDRQTVQNALKTYVNDGILEIVMLSHLHADHIGGMQNAGFFSLIDIDVEMIIDSGSLPTTTTASNYINMRERLMRNGTIYKSFSHLVNNENKIYPLDNQNFYLEFFDTGKIAYNQEPSDVNASSVACCLNYQNFKCFFAGDLPSTCENKLISSFNESQNNYFNEDDIVLYKSCHHSSNSSNGDALLSYVHPDYIFTMSGIVDQNKNNQPLTQQHPYINCLNRMRKYTEKIYWSSINGTTEYCYLDGDFEINFLTRTVDYYYQGEIVSREEEKDITVFESKYYLSLI